MKTTYSFLSNKREESNLRNFIYLKILKTLFIFGQHSL